LLNWEEISSASFLCFWILANEERQARCYVLLNPAWSVSQPLEGPANGTSPLG